jgi:hypothetical protein
MYKMIRTRRDHMLYKQQLYLGQTELRYFPVSFQQYTGERDVGRIRREYPTA